MKRITVITWFEITTSKEDESDRIPLTCIGIPASRTARMESLQRAKILFPPNKERVYYWSNPINRHTF